MPRAVGIDLGTTNSVLAIIDETGKAKVIQNREGDALTPSAILFDGDSRVVGREARNEAMLSPEDYVCNMKRQMSSVGPDGKLVPMYVDQQGKEWTAPQLSAAVLAKVKNDASEQIGEEVTKAVITVPAYFKDVARNGTKIAGEIANLEVLRVLNEPTAAIAAYGVDQTEDQTVLVYDLGGGTFDVTIARIENRTVEVIATSGDSDLGGTDFDNKIVERFEEETGKQGISLDPVEDAVVFQEIREKAESAKKSLSTRKERFVSINVKGTQIALTLTREAFENDTAELLKRTEDKLHEVLAAAELGWQDISKVLLVGGATRMPMVLDMIKRVTGKRPAMDIDPDKCVAMGAAILAAKLDDENGGSTPPGQQRLPTPQIEFVDVTAHPLGCAAIMDGIDGERNAVIVPANTAIPTKRDDVFALSEPYQTACSVKVLQGKERAAVVDCLIIGEVGLADLPPEPCRSQRIEVTYGYDTDGIVTVTVKDRVSGKTSGGKIEHKAGLTQEEVNEAKKDIRRLKGE